MTAGYQENKKFRRRIMFLICLFWSSFEATSSHAAMGDLKELDLGSEIVRNTAIDTSTATIIDDAMSESGEPVLSIQKHSNIQLTPAAGNLTSIQNKEVFKELSKRTFIPAPPSDEEEKRSTLSGLAGGQSRDTSSSHDRDNATTVGTSSLKGGSYIGSTNNLVRSENNSRKVGPPSYTILGKHPLVEDPGKVYLNTPAHRQPEFRHFINPLFYRDFVTAVSPGAENMLKTKKSKIETRNNTGGIYSPLSTKEAFALNYLKSIIEPSSVHIRNQNEKRNIVPRAPFNRQKALMLAKSLRSNIAPPNVPHRYQFDSQLKSDQSYLQLSPNLFTRYVIPGHNLNYQDYQRTMRERLSRISNIQAALRNDKQRKGNQDDAKMIPGFAPGSIVQVQPPITSLHHSIRHSSNPLNARHHGLKALHTRASYNAQRFPKLESHLSSQKPAPKAFGHNFNHLLTEQKPTKMDETSHLIREGLRQMPFFAPRMSTKSKPSEPRWREPKDHDLLTAAAAKPRFRETLARLQQAAGKNQMAYKQSTPALRVSTKPSPPLFLMNSHEPAKALPVLSKPVSEAMTYNIPFHHRRHKSLYLHTVKPIENFAALHRKNSKSFSSNTLFNSPPIHSQSDKKVTSVGGHVPAIHLPVNVVKVDQDLWKEVLENRKMQNLLRDRAKMMSQHNVTKGTPAQGPSHERAQIGNGTVCGSTRDECAESPTYVNPAAANPPSWMNDLKTEIAPATGQVNTQVASQPGMTITSDTYIGPDLTVNRQPSFSVPYQSPATALPQNPPVLVPPINIQPSWIPPAHQQENFAYVQPWLQSAYSIDGRPRPPLYPIAMHIPPGKCLPENSLCDRGRDEQCCGSSTFCVDYWGISKCLAYRRMSSFDYHDAYQIRNNNNYKNYYNYLLTSVAGPYNVYGR